jgi:uncharacterized protein with HEPN domain
MYLDKKDTIINLLDEVERALALLRSWNSHVESEDDYLLSPEGMKNLAASCMLIEAIGESFKKIDKLTGGDLLSKYPSIPWKSVMGIRDHIAHGYFDIDSEIIFATVKNDLTPLSEAVDWFKRYLNNSLG